LNECGRAFQVREACADFEELRGFKETSGERMFLMKDWVTVEKAVG